MSYRVQVLAGDENLIDLPYTNQGEAEEQAERAWLRIGNAGNLRNASEVRVIDGKGDILSQFEF